MFFMFSTSIFLISSFRLRVRRAGISAHSLRAFTALTQAQYSDERLIGKMKFSAEEDGTQSAKKGQVRSSIQGKESLSFGLAR